MKIYQLIFKTTLYLKYQIDISLGSLYSLLTKVYNMYMSK